MKLNIIQFVKRAVLLLLAGAAWSCSSKDELEEMLSKETTPVTFRVDAYTAPIFFDYTEGWRYIGSDTVKNTSSKTSVTTLNLHQGKHNIVAVKNVETHSEKSPGVHFNPEKQTFFIVPALLNIQETQGVMESYGTVTSNACYWHRQLEVSPYLLPEQQPDFQPVTASLGISVTDFSVLEKHIKPNSTLSMNFTIPGIPIVEEVGIDDNHYEICKETHTAVIEENIASGKVTATSNMPNFTLCPRDGLDNIKLTLSFESKGVYQTSTHIDLPKFSLRRGYTTVLSGPLFSGSASDWTVEMVPY